MSKSLTNTVSRLAAAAAGKIAEAFAECKALPTSPSSCGCAATAAQPFFGRGINIEDSCLSLLLGLGRRREMAQAFFRESAKSVKSVKSVKGKSRIFTTKGTKGTKSRATTDYTDYTD